LGGLTTSTGTELLILIYLRKPCLLLSLSAAFGQSAQVLKEVPLLTLPLLLRPTALLVHKATIATATAASTVANACRLSLPEPITIAAVHRTVIPEIGAPKHTGTHGSLFTVSADAILVPETLAAKTSIVLNLLAAASTEIIHTTFSPRALLGTTAEAGASRYIGSPHSTSGTTTKTSSGATSGAKSAAR